MMMKNNDKIWGKGNLYSGIDDIVFCYYFVYVRYMLSMDGLMMIMIMVMCIIIIWFWITCWLVSLIGWLVFDCNRINFEWIWKWTKKKNEILNRWSNQINDILLLFSLSFLNIFDIHSISLITSSLCVYVFIHLPFFLFSLMEKFFFFVHSSKRKKRFQINYN